jgi:hypothetical protein
MENQKLKIIGNITAKIFNQKNLEKEAILFNENLRNLFKNGIINRKQFFQDYIFGELCFSQNIKNIIANVGFNTITRRLTGDTVYDGEITVACLGTGTGTPSVTDTKLFNEVFRNEQASKSVSNNKALFTAFYDTVEVSGTFTEFGNFIDGDPLITDDGILWSHISGLNWIKDNLSTMTVSQEYTILND